MNEEYLIKIRGSMEQDGQAPADPIELMTRGSFVRKGSSYYIPTKKPRPPATLAAPPP